MSSTPHPITSPETNSVERRPPTPWIITAGILILCLIWGSTWLVIREGLNDLPPLTSAAVRFVVAGLVMVLIAPRIARAEGGTRPNRKLVLVYALLTLSIPYGVIYHVETILPSGLVSILWSIYPLILAFCAHLSLPEERLASRQWFGLAVGFLGVVLLFLTEVQDIGSTALSAALVLLISPAISAVGNTFIKRDAKDTSSALLNRDGTLLGALFIALAAAVFEYNRECTWSRAAITGVLYLALVGSVLAFSIYYWLLRYAPATRMSLLVYGIPVVAITLGVTLGDETVGVNTWIGMGAILTGVFLVLKPSQREHDDHA